MISKKRKILIINCGLGNIGSLLNALSFIGFEVSQADNYDSSLNFDSYFARSFKPKRIYERSPKSNLKKSTRKTTPKKKSAPPDAKTID